MSRICWCWSHLTFLLFWVWTWKTQNDWRQQSRALQKPPAAWVPARSPSSRTPEVSSLCHEGNITSHIFLYRLLTIKKVLIWHVDMLLPECNQASEYCMYLTHPHECCVVEGVSVEIQGRLWAWRVLCFLKESSLDVCNEKSVVQLWVWKVWLTWLLVLRTAQAGSGGGQGAGGGRGEIVGGALYWGHTAGGLGGQSPSQHQQHQQHQDCHCQAHN